MRVKINIHSDWSDTRKFLKRNSKQDFSPILKKYGERGVEALRAYTPKDTGLTSDSWYYTIEKTPDQYIITWCNSNMAREAIPIALLIQYGHATKNGGFVQGTDYINPALTPIFDDLSNEAWKEVNR